MKKLFGLELKMMMLISYSQLLPKNKLITLNPYSKMVKRHIYKDNWIIEFTPTCFHAFILNVDDDVEDKTFLSLEKAKEWIDKNSKSK